MVTWATLCSVDYLWSASQLKEKAPILCGTWSGHTG